MEKKGNIFVTVIATLICCGFSVSSFAQERDLVINEVTIPLEFHENGKIKVQLFADTAKMLGGKDIDALSPRVEFYDETGNLQAVMSAENCLYNKKKRVITTDSDVKLEQAGVIITGTGLIWNAQEEAVKILKDVKVMIKEGIEPVKKK